MNEFASTEVYLFLEKIHHLSLSHSPSFSLDLRFSQAEVLRKL